MSRYTGTVNKIISHTQDGFYALSMDLGGANGFNKKVVGVMPGFAVAPGTIFSFEGKATEHPKWGFQIDIVRGPLPPDDKWTVPMAVSVFITEGVTFEEEHTIHKALNAVSTDRLFETLSDKEEMVSIFGDKGLKFHDIWNRSVLYYKLLSYLQEMGLPQSKIKTVFAMFEGEIQKEIVTDNPWLLFKAGLSLAECDALAVKLCVDLKHPNRVCGVVMSLLHSRMQSGHTFLSLDRVLEHISKEDAIPVLKTMIARKDIVFEQPSFLYDPWLYELETTCASMIQDRMMHASFDGMESNDVRPFLKKIGESVVWSEQVKDVMDMNTEDPELFVLANRVFDRAIEFHGTTLSQAQKEGVRNGLMKPISLLTGLPGTGKTHSLRILTRILGDAEVNTLLIAPTGIAAKRMTALTGKKASTIHMAFGAMGTSDDDNGTYVGIEDTSSADLISNGRGEDWAYSPDRPHDADVVICDETSMLSLHTLYRILHSTKPTCRIVFVGDPAQIPSVEPGQVLFDLIQSKQIATVKLTEIFRQKETSGIVVAAHDIVAGRVPDYQSLSGFKLAVNVDEDIVLQQLIQTAEHFHDKRIPFQVLSPTHKGTLGVTNLNKILREKFNPATRGRVETRIGKGRMTVREGDRVMITKNNYRLSVFNGDVGKIEKIRPDEIVVKLDNQDPNAPVSEVTFSLSQAGSQLRLAYACTIHKYQGLEIDVVLLPIVPSFSVQLQRNLFYTAVTRAKKLAFLFGDPNSLRRAVTTEKGVLRDSNFAQRIAEG